MPLKDDLITPANETIENTDHLFWAESLDPNDYENFSAQKDHKKRQRPTSRRAKPFDEDF